jgi:NAD+---dinitrogen-reductase ADP-D-ribosyltransferase
MVIYMTSDNLRQSIPKWAKLPINRCNLPPEIVGSLAFQQYPRPLHIDGVHSLHKELFRMLDSLNAANERAMRFVDYMTVHFLFDDLGAAGASEKTKRKKATYLRLLRGWFFDSDGLEAAVLKGWVESRFGLSPLYHQGRLQDKSSPTFNRYMKMRCDGLYNTNALEAQLDLLYSYTQYELARSNEPFVLYRGINRLDEFDIIRRDNENSATILFNNLNSFSQDKQTACAFGDIIMEVLVPKEKILCAPGLLSDVFSSEKECMVLGGLYHVQMSYM